MKPLSPFKRRTYVWLFFLLFALSVPAALLYAAGYRYKAGYGLVKTGGIFLSIPYNDATVSLNGEEIGRTSLLNKGFYIDELAPSAYAIHVSKEGAYPWYRTLVVEPQLVTEARAVLVSKDIVATRLTRGDVASSTRSVPPQLYDEYRTAFRSQATSTTGRGSQSDLLAYVRDGDVFVRWMDAGNEPPDFFCGRPSYCVAEVAIERGAQNAIAVAFFGGGIVYATEEGGVFFSEIDVRSTPVVAWLYPYREVDMRVVGGALIVKNGNTLYEIKI